MKKIVTLLVMLVAFSLNAQTYFTTTSSSSGSNADITHLWTLMIGKNNPGYIPNPWMSYNSLLLGLDNQDKDVAFQMKNDYGFLMIGVASVAGSHSPISKPGDAILYRAGGVGKNMIFKINNSANDGNHAIIFGDNLNTRTLSILNNGKVGIGTGTPDTELAVNGTIHSRKVLVDLEGWAEFVFEYNYKLPTLKEVEEYIKDKGHLQGIPSKEEALENGIELGEMSAKLLQKIEELTLYAVEQQKLIEKLQKDLKDLQEKSK